MSELTKRIEYAIQMIEDKPFKGYADYLVRDLLKDIQDILKEKDDEQRDRGESH